MKIIVLMPFATGKYEDDTSLHCKALETYGGHELIRIEHYVDKDRHLQYKMTPEIEKEMQSADVMWCPYEDMLYDALELNEKLNKPLIGHFEIALVGRVLIDSLDIHWMNNLEEPNEKEMPYYNIYRSYIASLLKCDIKTITGQYQKYRCEKLIGIPLRETLIKPYPFDSEMYDKYIKEDVVEKYQVCTIYRPVYYKRTTHILKALSMLKNPPKYIIAGEDNNHSEEIVRLKQIVEENNLDVEFVGSISDEEKVKLLQESMFTFSHYGWLPPTEAAYLKKPCVCYFEPDTYDRLKELPYYVQSNNIKQLAESIEKLSNNEDFRKDFGQKAYNKLMNNECHTHLLKEDSRILTEQFQKAIDKKGIQNEN